MATNTLVVLQVPLKVIQIINSIFATFFGGENNESVKRKWGGWEKLCKMVKGGGIGVKKLTEINKSFHIKFA